MRPINGYGIVSEWLGSGLQNRLQRFESARCLRKKDSNCYPFFVGCFFVVNLRLKEGIPYFSKFFTPLYLTKLTFISLYLYIILVFDESSLRFELRFAAISSLYFFISQRLTDKNKFSVKKVPKTIDRLNFCLIFALTIPKAGCSVARSSRLVWDQEVAGSNPATPT